MWLPDFGRRNSELLQPAGYSQNFRRFVDVDAVRVDRLAQILEHGLVSEREALARNIPWARNLQIYFTGMRDTDDIIYLFPFQRLRNPPRWGDAVTLVLDKSLPVMTYEDMNVYQGGSWIHLSPSQGEVYMFGRVDPSYIREILLPIPSKDQIAEVTGLIQTLAPGLVDTIGVH
jgi:hypothetical protein